MFPPPSIPRNPLLLLLTNKSVNLKLSHKMEAPKTLFGQKVKVTVVISVALNVKHTLKPFQVELPMVDLETFLPMLV